MKIDYVINNNTYMIDYLIINNEKYSIKDSDKIERDAFLCIIAFSIILTHGAMLIDCDIDLKNKYIYYKQDEIIFTHPADFTFFNVSKLKEKIYHTIKITK